jgi:hypothetical protein
MSVPAARLFNIETLRRYDGPAWFLGAGFVAGLLCFAVWVHGRPDGGRHAPQARGNGVVGMSTTDEGGRGVLGDITGKLHPGAAAAELRSDDLFSNESDQAHDPQAAVDSTIAPDQRFDQDYVQDANAMAVAPEVGDAPASDGALTDSLLGPPPPDAAQAAPAPADAPSAQGDAGLRAWYVEVEVAPGVVQMLQLNAESPEHALAILRDFRGNPHVLRGPSPEPLP